jgi:exosortase A
MEIAPRVGDSEPRRASDEADLARRWFAIGGISLVVLTFLLYWPTTLSLMGRWEDTVHRTYTHGYLVVAISLWLLWRQRADVPALRPSLVGAGAVALLSLCWLVAWRAGLQIVHQALLPLIAAAAVLTSCGPGALRRMWLPLAYLYFAVPVWDAINPLLQSISVFAVRALLRLVGIPAFFADNTFQIPAGGFEIADGCSGLHFFIVGVAVAVLYGAINRDTFRVRMKLVLLAAFLAMATNWLRIFIIVIAGHLTDMQHYLVSGEHYSFGWFMFAGAMLLYFVIVRRWPLSDARTASPSDASPRMSAAALGLAVAALIPIPLFNLLDRNTAELPNSVLPEHVVGWQTRSATLDGWSPIFAGADAEQRIHYSSASSAVEAYAAAYVSQGQDKEVGGYQNSILGKTLNAQGQSRTTQRGWTEYRVYDSRGREWLLWHAYRLDENWYTTPLDLQFAYGLRALWSAPLTSVIALRSACTAECDDARRALEEFTAAVWK